MKQNNESCPNVTFLNLDSNPAFLIVGTEDVLLKIDLRNTSRRTNLQVKNVVSLDFSSDENMVYWSNKKEINQLSLQTGISEVIPFHHNDGSSVPFPEGLAVDWISDKLYWTDAKRDAIYVGNLRNGRKVTIIKGKLDSPKAIVVSPSSGLVKQMTIELCPTERNLIPNFFFQILQQHSNIVVGNGTALATTCTNG